MLLLIDNYDSFSHNLARYFAELGCEVLVKRNDELSVADVKALAPQQLVISPGPCTPDDAGQSLALIEAFAGQIPILGVCLGHQAIGQVFGASVVRAPTIMHGKTSIIEHGSRGLFAGIECPTTVTRYHSLILDPATLPAALRTTAWCRDPGGDTIMAIEHVDMPVYGVQFHPESVLSLSGHAILRNFIALSLKNKF